MNRKSLKITGLLIFLLAVTLITGDDDLFAARKLVKIDGSSTVFPITEAVAEEFQIEKRGKIMVTVGISGTGGGFKKFCRAETDISDASRQIKQKEIDLCNKKGIDYIELAIAYDGLAVVVNQKNNWVDYITVDELKKLWEPGAQRKVTKWNQIRKEWPDKEIHLYGPGTDSGTFDYFTKVINGAEGASRGDFTASEDDNVLVQGISTDNSALGYFGLAYYEYNKDKLKIVPVDDKIDGNGKGPIIPSLETVNNGTYHPLSRPIFIYVSKQSLAKPEVAEFVKFYLTNAGELSEEVGYISLPEKAYMDALMKIKK